MFRRSLGCQRKGRSQEGNWIGQVFQDRAETEICLSCLEEFSKDSFNFECDILKRRLPFYLKRDRVTRFEVCKLLAQFL